MILAAISLLLAQPALLWGRGFRSWSGYAIDDPQPHWQRADHEPSSELNLTLSNAIGVEAEVEVAVLEPRTSHEGGVAQETATCARSRLRVLARNPGIRAFWERGPALAGRMMPGGPSSHRR